MRFRPRRLYIDLLLRLRRLWRSDHLRLAVLGAVVGVICGYAAIGFREAFAALQWAFFGEADELLYSAARALPWYWILLVPTLGGLVIGLFIRYAMPTRRPLGVAEVIEATETRGGRLSLRNGLLASMASAGSIGVGASVGREGPVVLLGATLGSFVAQRLRLSRSMMLTLVGCGVAAAVAASFNAPLAGAIFALEVVIGHYQLKAFAPVVIASVSGTAVSRAWFGDYPAFVKPSYEIASFWEFPAFALLGVVAAIAALALMASIMAVDRQARRLPGPQWIRPGIAGLLVGCIALMFPQVLGVGYEATDIALKGGFTLWLLLALIVAKTAATAISLGGGFGGGVFSPSLVVGAMVGGAFGIIASSIFPDLASAGGAYTLVGMGAVAAAVLGAPISTILIMFELTGDYEMMLAVMIATVVSSAITQSVIGKSFFTWQLARRGVEIVDDRALQIMRGIEMRSIMDRRFATVDETAPLDEARRALLRAPHGVLFVTGAEGGLRGTVTFADLHTDGGEGEGAGGADSADATVGDAMRRSPPFLLPGDTLDAAVDLFAGLLDRHAALVESRATMTPIGVVHHADVLLAYQRSHLQVREERTGRAVSGLRRDGRRRRRSGWLDP